MYLERMYCIMGGEKLVFTSHAPDVSLNLASINQTPWGGSTSQLLNSAWNINGCVANVTDRAGLLQIRFPGRIWNNKLNNDTFFIR